MSTTVSKEMYFLHVVLSYLKVYPVTHNQLLLNTLDKADSTILKTRSNPTWAMNGGLTSIYLYYR